MDCQQMQTRRRWLMACAGATAGVTALAGCASDSESGDDESEADGETPDGFDEGDTGEYGVWPMAHYDAANTAVAPNSGPDSKPEKAWSVEFESEPTIPVVANGTIYVGTLEGTYYGISLTNEEVLWEYNTGEFGVPAVSNNAVYISGDGVEAFDHNDQKQIWTSGHDPLDNLRIQDGIIYGFTSNRIYGIEEESGDEIIEIETSENIEYMTIGKDRIYANIHKEDDDYQIESYEKGTGNHLWDCYTEDLWNAQFTIVDGTVYTVDSRAFISINPENGEKQIIKEFDPETGASPRSPTIYGETAYVPTSEYLKLPAIDLSLQSESQEWDYEGAIAAWKTVAADNVLYVWGSENPQDGLTLHAIDPETGDVKWTFDTKGAEDPGVPVILEDCIIFADDGAEQVTILE